MKSEKHLILFAHPRSGSSSLYKILQLHPELNILEEPFNEHFTEWNANNQDYLALIHDIPTLDEQLRGIFLHYNGVKLLDYQLPDDLAVHLLQRPDCRIIFLRRRNILQSVVSVLIAVQNQLWKKWEQTKPLEEYYNNLKPLDISDIKRRIRAVKTHMDYFEAVIDSRLDRQFIKLTYEDLYFAPAEGRNRQIATIWDFLDISPLEPDLYQYYLQPEAVKINSAATYAWLPNAAEIQQLCGNEATGWLYESRPYNI